MTTSHTNDSPVRVNLGAGGCPIDGWISHDHEHGKDVRDLSEYADGSVDELRASHVIEHLPRADVLAALDEWFRVLKPGGRIRVATVDIDRVFAARQAGHPDGNLAYIIGGQLDESDFHRSAFGRPELFVCMTEAGFVGIRDWEGDNGDCSTLPVSLNFEAIRPAEKDARAAWSRKIAVVMPSPRYGVMRTQEELNHLCRVYDLNYIRYESCFYSQNMQRGLTDARASGAEWALCADFDTMFRGPGGRVAGDVFERLCTLMELNPGVDAIAPLQVKRGTDGHLFNIGGQPVKVTDLDCCDLAEADSAHFGFTLIRLSSLQRMEKPWFQDLPDADGEYSDGRVDPDIFFWQKFKAAGNKLCIAANVCVGHMQEVVSWPTQNLGIMHQYYGEYSNTGRPWGARK